MRKQLKGLVIGLITGIIITLGIAATATEAVPELATLYNVQTEGIRIVIDGKEFTCTDATGAVVKPMIYNGTTYIPARAVSTAFGKAVYWDGEESTVYLGKMDGKLQNPTAKFNDLTNIAGDKSRFKTKKNVFDIRDGFYSQVYYNSYKTNDCCEYLLGEKYSKFKATLFVEKGSNWSGSANIKIIGDEQMLYLSPDMIKTSEPINIEVDITGVDNFKLLFEGGYEKIYIANAGFYQ